MKKLPPTPNPRPLFLPVFRHKTHICANPACRGAFLGPASAKFCPRPECRRFHADQILRRRAASR